MSSTDPMLNGSASVLPPHDMTLTVMDIASTAHAISFSTGDECMSIR
jgi:hypothetical protein